MNQGEDLLISRSKTPTWVLYPFKECFESLEILRQLVHLSIRGISVLRGMPKLKEALAKADEGERDDEVTKRIERAKREASLAQSEVKTGFPLLYAQAIVSLWGLVENCIINFVAQLISNRPETLRLDAFTKLRVRSVNTNPWKNVIGHTI